MSKYECHSGGAYGTDYFFGECCRLANIPCNHWYLGKTSKYNAPYGNMPVSREDELQGKYKVAKAANFIWGYQYNTMNDPRLIRNWCQVKYADEIFAVAKIVPKGTKVSNKPNDTRTYLRDFVSGGTGYAVAMAILEHKPVWVFDLTSKLWHKWSVKPKHTQHLSLIHI